MHFRSAPRSRAQTGCTMTDLAFTFALASRMNTMNGGAAGAAWDAAVEIIGDEPVTAERARKLFLNAGSDESDRIITEHNERLLLLGNGW